MEQSRGGRWGIFWICLIALLIGAYKAWLMVDEPLLGSDSGFRVFNAQYPVARMGNRIWLPYLQIQIWLFRLMGAPFVSVKLIGAFHLALGTMCLGLYWRRVLGASAWSTVLAIVAAVCFAAQWLSVGTGDLMQEPIGAALFFAVLLIASNGGPLPLAGFAIAAAALATRDSYWIYLFVVTLVGLRRWPWSWRRLGGYGFLWAVPILWLGAAVPLIYFVAFDRLPRFPIEWPLMYNPAVDVANPMSSAESLWLGLVHSRTLPLAAAVALGYVMLAALRRRTFFDAFRGSEFAETTIRSAPIALLVVYGLVWAVDPWQVTPGNARAAWPVLEISFAVAPLLIAAAGSGSLKLLVAAPVVAGMIAGLHPEPIRSRQPNNAFIQLEQAKLTRLLADPASPQDPSVCLSADEIWTVFREVAPPLFHNRKTWFNAGARIPRHCDILVVDAQIAVPVPDRFRKELSFSTIDHDWDVYRKTR